MFIPSSKGGILTSLMKEKEESLVKMTRFRVKIQEAGGTKLANMFSTDLTAGDSCGRDDCRPCGSKSEQRQNCKKRSILYESTCGLCNPETEKPSNLQKDNQKQKRKGIYIGESSRSLFERSREHHVDAEDFKPGSHMVKHWMTTHPEDDSCPQFNFRIIGTYKDCLSRQVTEALKIHTSCDELLNSKNEYASNCLARIVVDLDKYARRKKERIEEEEERVEAKRLEAFKIDKKRPKRQRSSLQDPVTNTNKRLRLDKEEHFVQLEEDDDLGLWLRKCEERCLRVGELKRRLETDRVRVLGIMEGWPSNHHGRLESVATRAESSLGADLDCVEVNMDWGLATTSNPGRVVPSRDTTQGPEEVGARHPNITPNTRSGLEGVDGNRVKLATRRTKPTPEYKLTSYAAWWRRIEHLEAPFYKEVRKEEDRRKKTKEEHVKKRKEKEDFVRKFFPSCSNSPGGTLHLRKRDSANSTGQVAVGKMCESLTTNSIFKKQDFERKKMKVNSSEIISSTKPVIRFFATPEGAQTADMRNGEISESRTYLGQDWG